MSDHETMLIETAQGNLTYQEVSDLVATRLLDLLLDIKKGSYSSTELSPSLIQEFHERISAKVLPENQVGYFRKVAVEVGDHYPPEPIFVSQKMWEFCDNLRNKISYVTISPEINNCDVESILEVLSYAEAEFLFIHPFVDFNGRVSRALIQEVCRRINIPLNCLVPENKSLARNDYFKALSSYDMTKSVIPLVNFWKTYRLVSIEIPESKLR